MRYLISLLILIAIPSITTAETISKYDDGSGGFAAGCNTFATLSALGAGGTCNDDDNRRTLTLVIRASFSHRQLIGRSCDESFY